MSEKPPRTKSSPGIMLAIETATPACSVTLNVNQQIFALTEIGKNVHSKVVLTMVQEVLEQAKVTMDQVDAVAVGQGPGSFTGLRIGIGVAQGLAFGVGCPMIGISSLDALANQVEISGEGQEVHVIAAIDARMGEVYWCDYRKDKYGLTRLSPLQVTPPENVIGTGEVAYQLVGNGWQEYSGALTAQLRELGIVDELIVYPSASVLAELASIAYANGESVLPAQFAPEYVRNDVAKKSTKPVL